MDHPPAPPFDPALLDMENMTADKWYGLIYNRIVQQEDIFVGDIKKKVIEIINMCMNKPNSTLESVRQDITSTITESRFEFEHQNFIEGIVGGAYEYLCQFIIKNSMENIKRTQSALNCFSLSHNLNYGAIKTCNDNILIPGSSKLTQIQCLSVSNNNTTDSDKAIQSYLLSNNSENDSNSMLMVERENIKNTTINKMETTSFLNYRSTLQIDNLSVEPANDIPVFSNMHNNDDVDSAHSSAMIDDDEKTTEAILSIASKIEQTNFNFVDDFEADEDINTSNAYTTNEIQTTKCLIEQNGDEHTDPSKLEEELKINNSLKLLETLVNIEHDKLEVQKSLTVNEIQPNNDPNEKMQFKSSKKTNIREKKSPKLHGSIPKVETEEEEEEEEEEEKWLPSCSYQNRSKNKTKTTKNKTRVYKPVEKVSKKIPFEENFLNTTSPHYKLKEEEKIKLANIGALISVFGVLKTKKNINPADAINSIIRKPAVFEPFPEITEYMARDEVKNFIVNFCKKNFPTKTSHVASTSNSNEKDVDNIKNKSSPPLSSVMKTSDYKKLYEKDRKSLFSPDVIITNNVSSKRSKDTTNELHMKKEYPDKKAKSKVQKGEIDNKSSGRKRKLLEPKLKIASSSPKKTQDAKSKPNSKQKSSYVKRSSKNSKKLKIIESDDEAETNADSNPNYESNSTYLLENKVSDSIDTLELEKLDRTNILKNNEFGEGTSKQFLNEVNIFENKKSNKNTLEKEAMPEWLLQKCELYDIKQSYVVINPFITY
ncbi:putative uncharacterized protein DDB_G0267840 [Myzus persicae]|uniref:putative uncharacterized protein DDB_G0267840 n=1 Tax=Myzus persicae TaxID=13164 RepID=UPI000B9340FA|nr:putative uncharacterized protein DDB_G0267840 [Myzus persicae]